MTGKNVRVMDGELFDSTIPFGEPELLKASAYRRYLDELDAESKDDLITVVIPEFVLTGWYSQILHNQSALALKARLLFRPNTVVTSVPILVE